MDIYFNFIDYLRKDRPRQAVINRVETIDLSTGLVLNCEDIFGVSNSINGTKRLRNDYNITLDTKTEVIMSYHHSGRSPR